MDLAELLVCRGEEHEVLPTYLLSTMGITTRRYLSRSNSKKILYHALQEYRQVQTLCEQIETMPIGTQTGNSRSGNNNRKKKNRTSGRYVLLTAY